MSKYFIISAGAKKRADIVYDARPGLYPEREYVVTEETRKIFLDTVSGNDANDGFTPATAKLTYAAAVAALGGLRTTIEVVNDGADLSGITFTAPTQMAPGAYGRAVNNAYTGSTLSIARPNVFANPIYFYDRGEIFTYETTAPFRVSRSVDNGESFQIQTFALTLQILRPKVCKNVIVTQSDNTDTPTNLGRLQISDLATFSQDVSIADAVARSVYFHATCCASHENKLYAVGTQNAIYSTVDITGRTGWTRVQGGEGVFDFRLLDCFENPATGTIFVVGYFIGTLSGMRTNRVIVLRKTTNENTFTEISFSLPGYSALPAGAAGNAVRFLETDAQFQDGTFYRGVIVVSSGTNNWIYRVFSDDTISNFVALTGTGISKHVFSELQSWKTFSYGLIVLNPRTLTTTLISMPAVGNYVISTNSRLLALNSGQAGVISTTPTAPQISNTVIGFDLFGYRINGSVRSCRVRCCVYSSTISGSEISRCDIDSLHIPRNAIDVRENLFYGISIIGAPTIASGIQFTRNTVQRGIYMLNASATGFELFSTNAIETGIHANFLITSKSSNARGYMRNVMQDTASLSQDPMFTSIYDLQRESQGYTIDSPLVRRSSDYTNSQGQRRDIGAYSAYETNIRFEYERTFLFLKPSEENAVKHIRHNRANMNVSVDGTPDVFSDPFGSWEELVLAFRSLPNFDKDELRNHIAFVDYLDSLQNTRVKIHFDVDYEPTGTVTTAAPAAVGDVFLQLAPSSLAGGDVLTIAGETYHVLYVDNNRAILSRPLHTALLTGAVIAVRSPVAFGEFFYVPEQTRTLSRWYESDTQFFRGLTLRFVRRWPA